MKLTLLIVPKHISILLLDDVYNYRLDKFSLLTFIFCVKGFFSKLSFSTEGQCKKPRRGKTKERNTKSNKKNQFISFKKLVENSYNDVQS